MKNFYYVMCWNVKNPVITTLLETTKLSAMTESLTDIRIRSKHYLSFHEAASHCQDDFYKKLPLMFGDITEKEKLITSLTVMNPAFGIEEEKAKEIGKVFGDQHNVWDDNCCGTLFFCENEDETPDDDETLPPTWLFKYEIFFNEDSIELVKNGLLAFDVSELPLASFTSAYH